MYGPVNRTCASTESPRVSSATPSSPTHGVVPTAPVARACASRALELLRWGVSREICEHLLERQFPGVPIEIRQSCVVSTESAIRNYRSAFRWRPPVDLYRRSPGRASRGSRPIDSDGASRLDVSPSLLASPSAAVPLKSSQETVAIPPSGRAAILLSNSVSDEENADDVPFNESEVVVETPSVGRSSASTTSSRAGSASPSSNRRSSASREGTAPPRPRSPPYPGERSARRRRHRNPETSGRVGHIPAGFRPSEPSRPTSRSTGGSRSLTGVRRQRKQLERDLARLRERERHLRSHHHL